MIAENESEHFNGGKRSAGDAAGGGGAKRLRSTGTGAHFDELLDEAGCSLTSSREGHEFEVEDPRKLRRLLEQRLTLHAELRGAFLAGLEERLGDAAVLHAALKPMSVTAHAPVTGDSFVRVLLNVTSLQADVSRVLLERLPEFGDADGEEAPLPALILGQFRWLDHVADPHSLTERLLEVLPVCPEHVKKDAVTFLPEVATEDNYDAVIRCLEDLMGEDRAYVLPCIEALANLCLTPEQQSQVVGAVQERFQAADAEDLPTVARFLLQHAAPGAELKGVVSMLRESLHFVSASDPRLAVPDRKGKAAALGEGDSHPEQRLLEALRQALQLSPGAADAVLREVRALQDPEAHRVLDLWLLLVMLTLGSERRKAAEAVLLRKFAEGHAQPVWLRKGIAGHERAMLDFFPLLLSLAQQLLRHSKEPVKAAGAELYCCLFKQFSAPYNQQEVLRALHSHLGAQVAAEAEAALGVLVALAQEHTAALMRYAAFLTNILDYIDAYSDQQVHQVFVVFSELVAGACQEADDGSGSSGGGRSRMEDELMIFVRKQLSSAQGRHRRIGIIGSIALVQRLGAADSAALESQSAVGVRYREAMAALKDTFDSCRNSPEAFAFLCDELSRGVQRKAIARRLIDDLHDLLHNHLEDTFMCFLSEDTCALDPADRAAQVGERRLQAELWWNLDGAATPVALKALPLVAEELQPASRSAPLTSLFGVLRLACALEREKAGSLQGVEAMLGCPINLFEEVLADPQQLAGQPPDVRRCVLLGLWYTLNWCRELLNCFAADLLSSGEGEDQSVALKLLARVRCCCQLESLLDTLLQFAPPLFVLPSLGNTLDSSQSGLAAVAAAAKKPAAKASKGGGAGKKKKGVKFAGGDDGPANSGGGGSGSGANSQQTNSGSGGGATHSGATQGGAAAATQEVATAVSGGLGRMAEERAKQRSLLPPALGTLVVGAAANQEVPCYSVLPSAAYLLADLHSKLKGVLSANKRAFPAARASKQRLPADLADLTPEELLAAVVPLLPSIRRHFDAACNVFAEDITDSGAEDHDRDNFWAVVAAGSSQEGGVASHLVDACLQKLDIPAARAALSPTAAASRVRTLALDCVRQLLSWPGLAEPAHRHVLVALLSAFHKSGPQPGTEVDNEGLLQLLKGCFTYFSTQTPDLATDQPTTESLSHQHAGLLMMDGLLGLLGKMNDTEPTRAGLKLKSKMGQRISRAAESVLKQVAVDTEGRDLGSSVWKGRGPLLADVLRLYLSHKDASGNAVGDVAAAVQELAADYLVQVPEKLGGAEAAQPVDHFPSLSGATLSVWYRVCFEQLQAAFDRVVSTAVGLQRDKELMEAAERDGETLDAVQAGMKSAAAAFSAMFLVIKSQPKRVAMHVQAVKSGAKFLETFLKCLPFWARIFAKPQHQQAFQQMVRDIQKGTRVLQALCSESKTNKALPLNARVPAAKKMLERFVFSIKVFLTEANSGNAFWLGVLKHRDIAGREMPSQMYHEDEGSDPDATEEEEEGQYEDEEMGESQAAE